MQSMLESFLVTRPGLSISHPADLIKEVGTQQSSTRAARRHASSLPQPALYLLNDPSSNDVLQTCTCTSGCARPSRLQNAIQLLTYEKGSVLPLVEYHCICPLHMCSIDPICQRDVKGHIALYLQGCMKISGSYMLALTLRGYVIAKWIHSFSKQHKRHRLPQGTIWESFAPSMPCCLPEAIHGRRTPPPPPCPSTRTHTSQADGSLLGNGQALAEHMRNWAALVDMGSPGIVTVDIPFLPFRVPVPHAVLNRPLDAWRAITQQAHISSCALLLAGGEAGLVPRLGSGSCFTTCGSPHATCIGLHVLHGMLGFTYPTICKLACLHRESPS